MASNQDQPEDPFSPSLAERLSSWFGDDAPEGFAGIAWSADADAAASTLGLRCSQWTSWEGGGGYEACFDTDHPLEVLGARALVRLIRREGLLEGLVLRFPGSTRKILTNFVGKRFKMTTDQGTPYKSFGNGSAVRLDYDPGSDTCELTVAGPEFGKAFARYLLGRGLRTLAAGLGPR